MQYLPIFIQIKQQTCLVVGGGPIAARKVALLRKAEADVTVVSPKLCGELADLAAAGKIQHKAKNFSAEDLQNGYWKLYDNLFSKINILKRTGHNMARLGPIMRMVIIAVNLHYRYHIKNRITPGIV